MHTPLNKDIGSLIRTQIVGIYGPFNIPLEEYLFFIVVPVGCHLYIGSGCNCETTLAKE
jgi:hypothetical protein